MTTPSPYAEHQFVAQDSNNSWANVFSLVPSGSRVLDVGCSTGNLARALIDNKQCTAVGVDLNDADVEEANSVGVEAYVMDIGDPTQVAKLGTFDVIVCADVLEHLIDPRSTLRDLARILNPGGRLVYSIPNMAHLSIRLELLTGEFPYTLTGLLDNTHLHFYDDQEVASMFTDAGFAIVEELPVIVEYPEVWLTRRLASMGIEASPKFFEVLASSNADVYQLVGVAEPTGEDSTTTTTTLRRRLSAERQVRRIATEALERADSLAAENRRLKSELRSIKERIESLRRNPVRFTWNWVKAKASRGSR